MQGFGVCEGHPKEHLKNMANACGQSCRDFTPPGGETTDKVSQSGTTDFRLKVERLLLVQQHHAVLILCIAFNLQQSVLNFLGKETEGIAFPLGRLPRENTEALFN